MKERLDAFKLFTYLLVPSYFPRTLAVDLVIQISCWYSIHQERTVHESAWISNPDRTLEAEAKGEVRKLAGHY